MSSDEELKRIIQRGVRDGIEDAADPPPGLIESLFSLGGAMAKRGFREQDKRIEPIAARIREQRLRSESMAHALMTRSALALPAIQKQISTTAWLDRLKSIPFTEDDMEQQLERHTEQIKNELLEMGVIPRKLRELVPSLVENRKHLVEVEKAAVKARELYGKFAECEHADSTSIARVITGTGFANTEPEEDSLDEFLLEFHREEFSRLFLQEFCPHTDEELVLVVYDIWVEDFPSSYLKLDLTETLAFSDENELALVGEGWSVRIWFSSQGCCAPNEAQLLDFLSDSLGGEIVDFRSLGSSKS